MSAQARKKIKLLLACEEGDTQARARKARPLDRAQRGVSRGEGLVNPLRRATARCSTSRGPVDSPDWSVDGRGVSLCCLGCRLRLFQRGLVVKCPSASWNALKGCIAAAYQAAGEAAMVGGSCRTRPNGEKENFNTVLKCELSWANALPPSPGPPKLIFVTILAFY